LFGFALHAGMHFRKKAVYGRLRSCFLPIKRRRYLDELNALKQIVETDKSVLPAVIKFQDRGKMTFPHRTLLPFMQKCSRAIKAHLNCMQLKLQGKHVVIHTKKEVLTNQDLITDLEAIITFRVTSIDYSVVLSIYKDMLWRVIHTMANSLLSSQAMLERISKNKGVDAEMSLRDKLKAYAIDKQSHIQL